MKVILAAIFLAAMCCAFVGCESELPPNPNTQKRFERGVIGDGSLTQPDKSNDPLIKEETRVGY